MHPRTATKIFGIIFTVVVPGLVSAMTPQLSMGAGIPLIGVSLLIGISVLVWGYSHHSKRTWREKLSPLLVMGACVFIYSAGGYWYFSAHAPTTVADFRAPAVVKPQNSDIPPQATAAYRPLAHLSNAQLLDATLASSRTASEVGPVVCATPLPGVSVRRGLVRPRLFRRSVVRRRVVRRRARNVGPWSPSMPSSWVRGPTGWRQR